MAVVRREVPARAVTRGPRHHFFGYYDKCPWDATGKYLLALEVDFMDRPPGPDDVAGIVVVDLETGSQERVAETRAWNWQQGCMLQWNPARPDREIIFNDRREGRFVSVVLDIHTGRERVLPLPVYTVSRDGTFALTTNFARLHHTRPGYGYAGVPDPWWDDLRPEDDGIYLLDLETGHHRLVISLDRVARIEPDETMKGAVHWFNHLLLSPDDKRFVFLHRWRREGEHGFRTRMFTANPDGTDIFLLARWGMVSHFDWRDPGHVLAWARHPSRGDRFYLFADRSEEVEVVGEGTLDQDGHCSYSPDRRWILTDTYPDAEHKRTLILYRPEDDLRLDIGRFYSPPELSGEIRCDLHPRWSRDGLQVCIDSAHEGTRQVYVLDVSKIVKGEKRPRGRLSL